MCSTENQVPGGHPSRRQGRAAPAWSWAGTQAPDASSVAPPPSAVPARSPAGPEGGAEEPIGRVAAAGTASSGAAHRNRECRYRETLAAWAASPSGPRDVRSAWQVAADFPGRHCRSPPARHWDTRADAPHPTPWFYIRQITAWSWCLPSPIRSTRGPGSGAENPKVPADCCRAQAEAYRCVEDSPSRATPWTRPPRSFGRRGSSETEPRCICYAIAMMLSAPPILLGNFHREVDVL